MRKKLLGFIFGIFIIGLIGLIVYFATKSSSQSPGPSPGPGPGPGPHPNPNEYWQRPGAQGGGIPINKGFATITKYPGVGTSGNLRGTFGVNGSGKGQSRKTTQHGSQNNTTVNAWTAAAPYALYSTNTKAGSGQGAIMQSGDCINGITASWGKVPVDAKKKQLCYKLTPVGGDPQGKTPINVQIMETCGGNCAYRPLPNKGIIPDCPTLSGGGGLDPWSAVPINSMEISKNDQYGNNQYEPKYRCPAAQLDPPTRKKIGADKNNLPTVNVKETGTSNCKELKLPNDVDWCGGNFMHFDVDENAGFGSLGLVQYERIDCETGEILKS